MASDLALRVPSETLVSVDPEKALASAEKCATVLMRLVKEKNLSKKFGDKNHLFVEAWETVAHFYGVSGKIVAVESWTDEQTGEQGFEATAQAIHMGSGSVISEAHAICSNFEDSWSTRPKYEWENGNRKQVGEVLVPRFQLMSMAQTRALSKVLRNVFAFVVVLAGFDPTPAEEIIGNEKQNHTQANGKHHTVPNGSEKSEGPKKISDAQRKRIFAIAHSKNCPMPEIVKILKAHNFALANDVTVDRYDAVVKEIENYKAQP